MEPAVLEQFHAADPPEAFRIQNQLRHRCIVHRMIDTGEIRHVGGADAAYSSDRIYAAAVVMTFPNLDLVDSACIVQEIRFPYIPGLLSFREGPAIVLACCRLYTPPDVMFINGHGYAHPRRFGLASHIGVVLDIPTIGIAQRLLVGAADMPGPESGSAVPVIDNNEITGMAVRTVEGKKPVFVSAGHKVDLAQAVGLVLRTAMRHRLTEPIWHADLLARECRNNRFITGTIRD